MSSCLDVKLIFSGKEHLGLRTQPLPYIECRINCQVRQEKNELTHAEALAACLRCIDERGISSAPITELGSILEQWLEERDQSPELSLALESLKAGVIYALSDPSRRLDGSAEPDGVRIGAVTAPKSTAELEQVMVTALRGSGSADAELVRNFFQKLDGLSRGGDEAVDRSVRTL